jgi:hypothetical protein
MPFTERAELMPVTKLHSTGAIKCKWRNIYCVTVCTKTYLFIVPLATLKLCLLTATRLRSTPTSVRRAARQLTPLTSSSQANTRSTGKEIIFHRTPNVHCSVHKSPPLVPILRQMKTMYTSHPIPQSYTSHAVLTSWSPKLFLYLRFSVCLTTFMHATCCANVTVHFITGIIFGEYTNYEVQ